jgi:hypothetical protein
MKKLDLILHYAMPATLFHAGLPRCRAPRRCCFTFDDAIDYFSSLSAHWDVFLISD